ncbi:hypothetical protein V8C35DRAFT_261902 [Trichoderma chlorosporum]
MNLVAKSLFSNYSVYISRSAGISLVKVRLLPGQRRHYINSHFQSTTRHSIHKTTYTRTCTQLSQQPDMSSPTPTFQLWEFNTLFGADMHHLVLMQLTNNETALSNLKNNLREAISSGDVVIHEREYTQQDVVNIQSSAIGLLRCFGSTNDAVDVVVASGTLEVKLNEVVDDDDEGDGEMEWFEEVFGEPKFPAWENLGGRVVSLFEEGFESEE